MGRARLETGRTPSPAQRARIGDLAEQIDAHRKRVLAEHYELTLTGLYNELRNYSGGGTAQGAAFSAKDKRTWEKGLVVVLGALHADLDAEVFRAYGWLEATDAAPSDEQILERLVALNAERAREVAPGRWVGWGGRRGISNRRR